MGQGRSKIQGVEVFPKNIYKSEVVPVAQYFSSPVRDIDTQYIIGSKEDYENFPCFVDRTEHPDSFSRYNHAVSPSIYGTGTMLGYVRTQYSSDPPNMVPASIRGVSYCDPKCRRM
jgi:hypothetical protein